jgi:hypothetical protein
MVIKEYMFAKISLAHALLENRVRNVCAVKKLQNRLTFEQKYQLAWDIH